LAGWWLTKEVVNSLGEHLGQIDTLMQTGANDVLVVKSEERRSYSPFVADVIVAVDAAQKKY
jgi:16S rRNA processing protein RimM